MDRYHFFPQVSAIFWQDAVISLATKPAGMIYKWLFTLPISVLHKHQSAHFVLVRGIHKGEFPFFAGNV